MAMSGGCWQPDGDAVAAARLFLLSAIAELRTIETTANGAVRCIMTI
jgi:hypothetical protein